MKSLLVSLHNRPSSAENKNSLFRSVTSSCKGGKYHRRHSKCRQDDEDVLVYLKEHIDPVLSPIIIYVLKGVADAQDIPFLFLDILKKYKERGTFQTILDNQSLLQRKKKRRCRTLKFSTHIASFISMVLTVTVETRPKENVIEFLIATVERFIPSYVIQNATFFGLTEEKHFVWKQNNNTKDLNNNEKRNSITLRFLLVGMGGSGKTTLVSVLKGQNNPRCKPSLGFRPISLKYSENVTVKLYDVGGGEKIRNIWDNYYHDVHGVIYVVDSACSDRDFDVTLSVAKSTLGHKYLQGKPLLVISNKIDKSNSKPVQIIKEKMKIMTSEQGMSDILETSIHPAMHAEGKPDPNIDKALEWLIQRSLDNLDELNERIFRDSKEMKEIRKKKQEEKERRVFKTSLCKAFALNGEQCKEGVLGQREGEDFLAYEIGLSGHSFLPSEGKEVCSLVGYQRFALMIVGGMVQAKNALQKGPYSWSEVLTYVHSIRSELNL